MFFSTNYLFTIWTWFRGITSICTLCPGEEGLLLVPTFVGRGLASSSLASGYWQSRLPFYFVSNAIKGKERCNDYKIIGFVLQICLGLNTVFVSLVMFVALVLSVPGCAPSCLESSKV